MKFLLYVISLCVALGLLSASRQPDNNANWQFDSFGAAVGLIKPGQKTVHFIFTADSAFEGAPSALDALCQRNIKASFFFTGNFLRDSLRNSPVIRRIINEGHYVGPHGDHHILLADWNKERTTLASPDSALVDMEGAYRELAHYGISRDSSLILVPSFEWYNDSHIKAFREAGLFPVNLSPGIDTYRDYTTPDLPYYTDSETIWNQILSRENSHGLDGSFILIHLGTDSTRTDKFYRYLPALLDTLTARGYQPLRF